MTKNEILILLAIPLIAGGLFFRIKNNTENNQSAENLLQATTLPVLNENQKVSQVANIKQNVPFVVQAPFGNWSDSIFQNACEEASIVMAMAWVNGVSSISPQEAQKQILDIVDFENKNFGYNEDTNVFDVKKIFNEHFYQSQVEVKENVTIADVIDELQKGNLVLVPAFGQALGNPNYTPPGPIAHMLIISGYDSSTHEFITNDPGTKHGAGYHYNENILFDAIWEYPSGKGPLFVPDKNAMTKAIVIVSKH